MFATSIIIHQKKTISISVKIILNRIYLNRYLINGSNYNFTNYVSCVSKLKTKYRHHKNMFFSFCSILHHGFIADWPYEKQVEGHETYNSEQVLCQYNQASKHICDYILHYLKLNWVKHTLFNI